MALLLPAATLTIPVFLLIKSLGLMDTYCGCHPPAACSPFGVYFMNVYVGETMPNESIDSGRIDGASDYQDLQAYCNSHHKPGACYPVPDKLHIFVRTISAPSGLEQPQALPATLGLQMWGSKLINPATGISSLSADYPRLSALSPADGYFVPVLAETYRGRNCHGEHKGVTSPHGRHRPQMGMKRTSGEHATHDKGQ